jgi:hypothetical protein
MMAMVVVVMVMVMMLMVMLMVMTLVTLGLPDLQRWQLPSLRLRNRSCSVVAHFLLIARCIAALRPHTTVRL